MRLLAVAAALMTTLGAGVAAAQTVMIRNGPHSTSVEVMLNGKAVGTGTTDDAGEATIPLIGTGIDKNGIDANIYFDVCDKMRRVQLVDQTKIVPAASDGCDRRDISGLYWVRPLNTIVFDLANTDLPGAAPSLLLVRGSYVYKAPRDEDQPRIWRALPAGLLVYGGGGLGKLTNAYSQACGNAPNCGGTDSMLGSYTFGATFWLNHFVGVEGAYLKPRTTKVTGGDTYSFTTTQKTDIFSVTGKGGLPVGPVRVFGEAGMAYHVGTQATTETKDVLTQAFGFKTHGWSYIWGGGVEVWAWKKIAIYTDLGVVRVKGSANTGGEAMLDDSVRYLFIGGKFSLTQK
jgi:hypothetical protein